MFYKRLVIAMATIGLLVSATGCGEKKEPEYTAIEIPTKSLTLMPTIASDIEDGIPLTIVAVRQGAGNYIVTTDACLQHNMKSNGETKCKGSSDGTSCKMQEINYIVSAGKINISPEDIAEIMPEYKKIKK